jgi:diguanylate cyclase (GGDEF)-like protein
VVHAVPELVDQLRTAGWEVGEQLAGSPQSLVYRARRLGGDYALKVMRDGLDTETMLRAFRREAAMAAAVGHPGLPEIYEVGRAGRWPYLAMELLAGPSLADTLTAGPLRIEAAVDLALHLAQTLAAAHRAGMVHRDIKPDNVVFDGIGRPRLVDFGLAQTTEDATGSRVVGTLRYSSPEQAGMLKRPVDHRSDLYSLGVVLYECLTGSPPFAASDAGELLRAHAVLAPPPVRQLRRQATPALAGIVTTLLAKDPDDRYRSADGLAADLRRVAAGEDEFALRTADERFGVRGEPPLVGAGGELAVLLELWRERRTGGGGTALVGGGEGIGKSRLVREVAELARLDGCPVLTGRCPPDATPFAALREALDGHLRWVRRANPPELAAVRAAADAAAGLVAALSPTAARAIGRDGAGAGSDPDQFAAAVITFLTDLARRTGGLLLCLEDVHWLDAASHQVLRRLALELPAVPLLVACTGRDEPAGSLDRFRAATGPLRADLMVPELTEEGVRRLITAELGQPVDPVFARRLAAFARGNPFAVIESVRALVAGGYVCPFWGRAVVDEKALDDLDLPVDVFDLVCRQVEQLGSGQQVLAAAAVIGDRFGLDLLGVVSGASAETILATLSQAVRQALVEPTERERYRFSHGSVRQLLLDRLSLAQRRALHQRVAEALDRPGGGSPVPAGRDSSLPAPDRRRVYELARHYARGEVERTPLRTFETCWAAGRVALGEHAFADAAAFLAEAERASAAAGITPPTRFHATVGLARYAAGELDEAASRLKQALAGEQEWSGRVRLLDQLARVEYARPNYATAMNYSRQALAELGQPVPRNLLAAWAAGGWAILRGLVRLRLRPGGLSGERRERQLAHLQLAEPVGRASYQILSRSVSAAMTARFFLAANQVGPGTEYVQGYLIVGIGAATLRLRRVSAWIMKRAAVTAKTIGDPRLVARIEIGRGYAQSFSQEQLAVTANSERLLADHGRWLPTEVYIEAAMANSSLYSLRGYNREAEEWRLRAMERGARFPTILCSSVALGHTEEPEAQLRQANLLLAADNAAAVGPLLWGALVHSAVNVLYERGEFGADFDRLVAGFHRHGPTIRTTRLFFRRFWLTQAYGRLEQARQAAPPDLRRALAAARSAVADLGRLTGRVPVLRGHHRVAQAALEELEGRYDSALDRLAQAERIGDENDAPWVRFESLCVRARVLRAQGHLPAAATAAQAALALAERHSWVYRAARARKELAGESASSGDELRSLGLSSTGSSAADLRDRRYLNALLQVSTVASSVLDPRELARVALDELLRILGAERAYLFACASEHGPLERYAGRDADGNDLSELVGYSSTVVERARAERRPFIVTGSDAGAALGSQSAVAHGLRSIIVAPMQLEGRLLGVVYLDSRVAKGVFAAADEEILVAIANQIASSLETARAAKLEVEVEAERRQRELADQLREATGQLSRTLDPDEVLDRALHLAAEMVGANAGCVLLLAGPRSTVAAVHGVAQQSANAVAADRAVHAPVAGLTSVGSGAGWLGDDALTLGSPVLLPPVLAAPTELVSDQDAGRLPGPLYVLLGRPLRWLAIPLAARGERFGLLLLAGGGSAAGNHPAAGIVAVFARHAAAAYDNARLFRQVEQLAITDGLTGIYNRRHFMELAARELAAAHRHRRPVAAIMLDIDHFKQVNDRYGHAAGDEVIRVVAERLTEALRREDLLCRYGGEEFALLIRNDEQGAIALAERLRRSVQDAVVLTPDGPLHVTISVGVSMCLAEDGSPEQLLARADAALYAAKQDGRNRVATTT